MPIFSLNHKYVSRLKHKYRLSCFHLQYVLRKSACDLVLTSNIPLPKIGTRGGQAKKWLEQKEDSTRKNGRVIDKIMLALPLELELEQRTNLIRAFMFEISGGQEYFWLAALHDQLSVNPHVHIIVRDQGLYSGKRVVEFSEKNSTLKIRKIWEDVCNEHLAKANIEARIDCRSLKAQRQKLLEQADKTEDLEQRRLLLEAAQKLNRKPSGHEGPEPRGIEEKGGVSTKLERLREIRKENDLAKILESTTGCPPCPDADLVHDLLVDVLDSEPVLDQNERDTKNRLFWDQQFENDHERAGVMAMVAVGYPKASYEQMMSLADRHLDFLNQDLTHPLAGVRETLVILGRRSLNGGWRHIPELKMVVENTLDLYLQQPAGGGRTSEFEDTTIDLTRSPVNDAPEASGSAVDGMAADEALEGALKAQEQAEGELDRVQRNMQMVEEMLNGKRDISTGLLIAAETAYVLSNTVMDSRTESEFAREAFLERYCDADGDEAVGPLKPVLADYNDLPDDDGTFARHLAEWHGYEKDRLERAAKNKRTVWEQEFLKKKQQLAEYRRSGISQLVGAVLDAVRGIFAWLRERVKAARQTLGVDHALTQKMTADWTDVLIENKETHAFVKQQSEQTTLQTTQQVQAIKDRTSELWQMVETERKATKNSDVQKLDRPAIKGHDLT